MGYFGDKFLYKSSQKMATFWATLKTIIFYVKKSVAVFGATLEKMGYFVNRANSKH